MTRLNRATAWLSFALGVVSLLLGYIGYRSLTGTSMSRDDALFGSIQLFVMDAPAELVGPPLALNIARFTAPLSLALATVAALLVLLSQQVRRLGLRWRGRNHVVVIGLSPASGDLVRELRAERSTVVVIEANPDDSALAEARALGAVTLVGDPRQPRLLRTSRVGDARHVVVATGSDSGNLEIAEALSTKVGRRTSVHVEVADDSLWSVLGRVELEEKRDVGVYDFFHAPDRKAAGFVDTVDAAVDAGEARSVHLTGDGELAQRVLMRWVQRRLIDGGEFVVHTSSRTRTSVVEPLLESHPWLEAVLQVAETPPSSSRVALVSSEGSDGRALATALRLASRAHVSRVFVCSALPEGRTVLDIKGVSSKIRLLHAGDALAKPGSFFSHSWLDIMARARHEDYCATERVRGITREQNPSLAPWDELPESLRDSNRRFAAAVGGLLGVLGARLVPLQGRPHDEIPGLTPDHLEQMARNEHDRWMNDLLRDGWKHADAPKDPERRTHPLLVAWEELDEAEREKDRDSIRAIPRMLARAGYSLEVAGG